MKISKINLVNFRNYSNTSISLGNKMNIFVGNNAQGKTNILEGITILALTKSHRIGVNPNIIMFNKKKCNLSGTVKKNKIISNLEIEITEDSKKLKVNKKSINKVIDYISYLNVIILPQLDKKIVTGTARVQRNI